MLSRGFSFKLSVWSEQFLCPPRHGWSVLAGDQRHGACEHWSGSQWGWSRACPSWSSSCTNITNMKHSSRHPCNWYQVFPVPRYPSVDVLHATVGISSSSRLEGSCVSGRHCWPTGDGVHTGHTVGCWFALHWNSCTSLENNICELSWFFKAVIMQPKTCH